MIPFRNLFFGTLLIALGFVSLQADEILNSLKGTCIIMASTEANRFDLSLERGSCADHRNCGDNHMQQPLDAFAGLSLEGARMSTDKDAMRKYYGANVDTKTVLFDHQAPTTPPSAQAFMESLP